MTSAAEQAGVHRNTINNWRRNSLPFQQALAGAQYDRALCFREKMEELVDLACHTLDEILLDSNAPAGVRLKAALAIIQIATNPPAPKKQVQLDIEKILVHPTPNVHNSAQSTPDIPVDSRPFATGFSQTLHNSAQSQPEAPPPKQPGDGLSC